MTTKVSQLTHSEFAIGAKVIYYIPEADANHRLQF